MFIKLSNYRVLL